MAEIKYGDRRYAACVAHAGNALRAMDGAVIEVRNVHNDERYHCDCGRLADFYILEVEV